MGQVNHRQNVGIKRKTLSRIVASAGLAAVLSCGFSQNSVPTAKADLTPAVPAQPAPDPAKWKFDGKAAWDYLLKQVDFGPRVPGTEPQIKCRDWLLEELKKGCDDAHIDHLPPYHWSYQNKVVDIYNVVGTQNWKDAKVRVVLLAHWDSRPWSDGPNSPQAYQTKPFPYKPIPGADDGASDTAVLLELAQAIKDKHPGVGILYLLDDGEDLGPGDDEMLLGVKYFADHLPDPKPDYGILLDMIGKTNMVVGEEIESQKRAPEVVTAFYDNAREVGLSDTFPARDGQDLFDDHIPLLDKGIPTIDLIDFDYAQWHTQDDTPAHCSQKSLQATGVALESFLTKTPPFIPKKQ